MNDKIEFLFHTRTLSEDYRVFAGSGGEALKDEREFKRIMTIAALEYDEEESAVVYEDGGKVYVAAFGLMRREQDRAGRDKRFSFCLILPRAEKAAAMSAFSRLRYEWQETAEIAGELIDEIPVTRKDWKERDKRGEDVNFNSKQFIKWLVTSPVDVAFPKGITMWKYHADTGSDEYYEENDDDSGEGYMRWPIIVVVAALIITCSVIFWPKSEKEHLKPQGDGHLGQPEQSSNTPGAPSSQSENPSPTSPDEAPTPPTTEEAPDNGGHNNVNSTDRIPDVNAEEADNGGAGDKGSINSNERGNASVGSNDRISDNKN